MKYFCRYRVALSLSASLSSCIPCISILYSLACSHPLLRDLAPLRTHAPKSPHLLQIAPKKACASCVSGHGAVCRGTGPGSIKYKGVNMRGSTVVVGISSDDDSLSSTAYAQSEEAASTQ
eukprot:1036869-Rhodomonas_salina.3